MSPSQTPAIKRTLHFGGTPTQDKAKDPQKGTSNSKLSTLICTLQAPVRKVSSEMVQPSKKIAYRVFLIALLTKNSLTFLPKCRATCTDASLLGGLLCSSHIKSLSETGLTLQSIDTTIYKAAANNQGLTLKRVFV